jgi:hypothetical protein
VSASVLDEHFARSPFLFHHTLGSDHPLLERDALAVRADSRPPHLVEHHRADLPLVLPTGESDQLAISAGEVVRGLDDNSSWILLLKLEDIPSYRALLEDCLMDVALSASDGGVTERRINMVMASPNAVVPVHFDLHHNLLLQIDGTKEVTIGSFSDPAIEVREVDRHFDGATNNARALPDVVTSFHLEPGEGVYIPPYAMHWVRVGAQTSVAVSLGIKTGGSTRTRLVHVFNAHMRRRGLHPTPAGRSAHRDIAKVAALKQGSRVRRGWQVLSTSLKRTP